MKKKFFITVFLLILCFASVSNLSAATSSPGSIDGWWAGEVKTQLFNFNFKCDGNTLTGTFNGNPDQPRLPVKEGKIEGDRISFRTEKKIGGNTLRIDFKGDVKDHNILMSYTTSITDAQGNTQTFPTTETFPVDRVGTGKETPEDILKVLKKKFKEVNEVNKSPVSDNVPLTKSSRREIIEDLAARLTSDYAIAETGLKMADSLRKKLESRGYDSVTSPFIFARMLTEDLSAVAHDKHLRVVYSSAPRQNVPAGPPPADMVEKRKKQMLKMNGAIPKLEILDGNVGYMRINGVPTLDVSKDAISAAFAFLKNTDALILDNRGNGGGDPNTVAWYMSYLSEGEPYVVNTFHRRKENRIEEFRTTDLGKLTYGTKKPVFVLTSPNTFSGGEELTYDIQAFKRGLIVGEVTGGGANPTGPVPLVHNFTAIIPFGYAQNPVTKSNWEGTGVKPDVEVPAEKALVEAHLLAIKRLQEDTSDPGTLSALDAVSFKLEWENESLNNNKIDIKPEQIAGKYVPTVPIPPLTIDARNGDLYLNVPNNPEAKLVSIDTNRYKIDGLPDGFFANFRLKNEKVQMLLEQPQGPVLLEKQ